MITKHNLSTIMTKVEAVRHLDNNNVVVYFEKGLVKFICWKDKGYYWGREYYRETPPNLEICISNTGSGAYYNDAYVAIMGGWWGYFSDYYNGVQLYKDVGYYKVFTIGKIEVPRILQALKEF